MRCSWFANAEYPTRNRDPKRSPDLAPYRGGRRPAAGGGITEARGDGLRACLDPDDTEPAAMLAHAGERQQVGNRLGQGVEAILDLRRERRALLFRLQWGQPLLRCPEQPGFRFERQMGDAARTAARKRSHRCERSGPPN